MNKSYIELLDDLSAEFSTWVSLENILVENDDILHVNNVMKRHFPGNYKVVRCYTSNRQHYNFKLVFDNEQEEVIFKLRYS